jgi:hypothetical protein
LLKKIDYDNKNTNCRDSYPQNFFSFKNRVAKKLPYRIRTQQGKRIVREIIVRRLAAHWLHHIIPQHFRHQRIAIRREMEAIDGKKLQIHGAI